jgi:hypothetical protein
MAILEMRRTNPFPVAGKRGLPKSRVHITKWSWSLYVYLASLGWTMIGLYTSLRRCLCFNDGKYVKRR